MDKKNRSILLIIVLVIINVTVFNFLELPKDNTMKLSYDVKGSFDSTYQVLYSQDGQFNGQNCVDAKYSDIGEVKKLQFEIPKESKWVRLDLGTELDLIEISNIRLEFMNDNEDITSYILKEGNDSNDIGSVKQLEKNIQIDTIGNDPYIILDISNHNLIGQNNPFNIYLKIIVCLIITFGGIVLSKHLQSLINLIKELYCNRKLIWNLSKNDFKTKYAGSYLGITWAFVQPIVTVVIYWFVFQVGFKSAPMNDFPFVLWLIAGIVPWFFFNEALLNATNSLMEYNYLVKKVVFKISILPIVKIMSSLYVHIFFVVFANVVYLLAGYTPTIYMIQVIYYSFCTFFLVLGISYITSSIVIFFKDLGQIVNILLQFGMWLTPIMWSYDMISPKHQWILKINPMYYIVEGYRDTFIRHVWFWERYNQTIYFWIMAIGLFMMGTVIFKKLKVHFADVL